ncbi:hypothetical protein [Jeotgalibacillus sp. R-1-5s-1]|uniref:hypothetical protein n=1 Tax=Jeotgalibacillus sp. R-1-5s-1 TaxID=2555897 RepID=UPI00141AE9AB|nr:hypothetical protein [Jeotgalibacillus sp. R-1-5s-1]
MSYKKKTQIEESFAEEQIQRMYEEGTVDRKERNAGMIKDKKLEGPDQPAT